jgi:molybdenum cofactor synthesis domain-containing protein
MIDVDVEEARGLVLAACPPLAPRQVPIDAALGCVLAQEVVANEPIPPFTNSAMDGYALRADDTAAAPSLLAVVGSVMAGEHPVMAVGAGEAVRIMTGAPLPTGADAVCIIERTRTLDDATVVVEVPVGAGANVRYPGEDIADGETVFGAGACVSPGHVGVLAAMGIDTVLVHPRPVVGVLSTGDELVEGAAALPPGKIRDSNRHALLAQVRQSDFEAVDLGIVRDDAQELAEAFERGAARCDALVTSGGVCIGDLDMVQVVLDKLSGGTMRWMRVAVKPGKTLAFGTLAATGTPVFGLPGNPVSALVSFELFARPALRRMAGHRRLGRPVLAGVAEVDLLRPSDGKLHLVRAIATADAGGTVLVRPSGGQGSHMLRAMAEANCLALLPDGDGVPAGGRVDLVLLDADRLPPDTAGYGGSEGGP